MANGLYGIWFAHSSKLFAFCSADMQPSCLEVISSTWGGCNLLPLRLKLFSKSRRARRECAPQPLSGQSRFLCDSSLQARIVMLSGKNHPSALVACRQQKHEECSLPGAHPVMDTIKNAVSTQPKPKMQLFLLLLVTGVNAPLPVPVLSHHVAYEMPLT